MYRFWFCITICFPKFLFLSLFSHLVKKSSSHHHFGASPVSRICTLQNPGPGGCLMGFHVGFLSQGTTGTIFCPLLHGKSESLPVLRRWQSMEVGEKSRVWIQVLRKEETESEIETPVVPSAFIFVVQTQRPGFGEYPRKPSGKVSDCSRPFVYWSPQGRMVAQGWQWAKLFQEGNTSRIYWQMPVGEMAS